MTAHQEKWAHKFGYRFPLRLHLHLGAGLFGGKLLDGYVVDFLRFDFGFPPFNPWPSFNVADSCVVCAAILLAASTFFETPPEKKALVS